MGLSAGTRLGPYEIVGPLGAGGMGEVFRARDTRLDRTVAIKVLSSKLSDTPGLKQRFEREARTISSLQHPHICVLHDVGRDATTGTEFLVMECLEGETLADRLHKGPLPLADAFRIAIEIADALAAAHHAGVVHRDLKPGNVMLTRSGAKLLDFGLAKPLDAMATGSAAAAAPTFTAARAMSGPSPIASPLTADGSIVGTIQYMAPEQIEGKEADARSDIFAFGAMLYEMSTGKRPFEGRSQIKIASAILEDQPPPVRSLQPGLPVVMERLIETCLNKDPEARVQCAADLKLQLHWTADAARTLDSRESVPAGRRREPWFVAAATFAALLVVTAAVVLSWRRPAPIAIDAYILPPDKTSFALSSDDAAGPVVLSPDGAKLAFVAQDEHGVGRIYVRALAGHDAQPVAGTENANYPFWSPDSQSIAFASGGELRRVAVTGGPVLDICPVQRFRGASWGRDDIVFAPDVTNGIFRVAPNSGSTPVQITKVAADQTTNRWPTMLPDGRHFLYVAANHSTTEQNGRGSIYLASLDGQENRLILTADSNVAYAAGHLLWEQGGSLLAQAFDPARGRLTGDAVAVVANVGYNSSTWKAAFDANDNGVLVYQPGVGDDGQLLLVDAGAKQVPIPDTSAFADVRLSPDGNLAAALTTRTGHDLWLLNLRQGTRTRFDFTYTTDGFAWSHDGKYIFYSVVAKPYRIVRRAVDGSSADLTVFTSLDPLHVADVSADGANLLFEQRNGQIPTTTWILPLADGGKPKPLLDGTETRGASHYPAFSPDGKWIAYDTTETGRWEIYVTSVARGGKEQLTSDGGAGPRWSADAKTIYYRSGDSVSALPVSIDGDTLRAGKARTLFPINGLAPSTFFSHAFDVTPDGRRFLLNVVGQRSGDSRAVLVTNWPQILKK
jgi:Tol biopolymer transport system component